MNDENKKGQTMVEDELMTPAGVLELTDETLEAELSRGGIPPYTENFWCGY